MSAQFDAQYSPNRIVESRLGNFSRARLREGVGVQLLPGVGRHEHVEPGVDDRGTTEFRAAGDLGMGIPISNDEPVETHPVLQHVGQQLFVGR